MFSEFCLTFRKTWTVLTHDLTFLVRALNITNNSGTSSSKNLYNGLLKCLYAFTHIYTYMYTHICIDITCTHDITIYFIKL